MKTTNLAHCIVSSSLLLALSALGAGCVVEAQDAYLEEEDLAEAPSAIGLVNDGLINYLPEIGGNGGNVYADTLCPGGYVATGLQLRTGTWVDNIAMVCRQLTADGSLGATAITAGRGGSGGTAVSGSCANGQIMVGQVVGTNGQYVGKVGGKCASLSRVLAKAGGFDSAVGPFGSQGAITESICPAGSAVVGFRGRAGSWTDKVGFICKQILMPTVSLPVSSSDSGIPITINSVSIKGGGNAINVAKGEQVLVDVGFTITQHVDCPYCVDQILVGLAPNSPAGCVYDGVPSSSGTTGSGTVTITAPTTPGLYFLRHRYAQDYSCNLTWWTQDSTPDASKNIGVINVF